MWGFLTVKSASSAESFSKATGGKPDLEVKMRVAGPELGYVATPILLVQAAFVLLEEREKVAARLKGGGVFTAGSLLSETSYVSRVQKAGVTLEVVSEKKAVH